jgi:homoserine kinase
MTSFPSFTIQVPATSANLGPGFDSFGLALAWHNRFHFSPLPPEATADVLLNHPQSTYLLDVEELEKPEQTLLIDSLNQAYEQLGTPQGEDSLPLPRPFVQVSIEAHLPLASGLGSSATVVVAAVMAAHRLAGSTLSREQLAPLVNELEGHPDNGLPALLGGLCLCDEDAHHVSLPWPEAWALVALVPTHLSVSTQEARERLPESYSLDEVVYTLRKASLLTYALCNADETTLQRALHDCVHQPYRQSAIAEFEPLREQWLKQGGFGVVISGSGPSLLGMAPKAKLPELEPWFKATYQRWLWKPLPLDVDGAVFIS